MANILVCDDSSFTRKMIMNILKTEGHSFVDADNGDTLLEILSHQKFDCILLDLLMPKKNGFEVLSELQKMGNTCPIIVVSADTQETSRQMCKTLGAFAVLNKPPKHDELVETINKALS